MPLAQGTVYLTLFRRPLYTEFNFLVTNKTPLKINKSDGKLFAALLNRYGHAVAEWLRHYATNRKVTGSRPDEVNEFFQFI
jgi:hypothetical protein